MKSHDSWWPSHVKYWFLLFYNIILIKLVSPFLGVAGLLRSMGSGLWTGLTRDVVRDVVWWWPVLTRPMGHVSRTLGYVGVIRSVFHILQLLTYGSYFKQHILYCISKIHDET